MGSILDSIETTLDNGTSMIIAEKIFAKVLENIVRKNDVSNRISYFGFNVIGRHLTKEADGLQHCTVKDLYEIFLLNPDEIRHFCTSDYVQKVQDNSYSYYSCDFKNFNYEIHGNYSVNLDNALYLLTGGDVIVKWNNELKLVSEIDESHRKPVKNWITKAHVEFTCKFYECLQDFCYSNYEAFAKNYVQQ